MTQRQLRILQEAIEHFGLRHQAMITAEECGELLTALSHFLRGRECDPACIITELVDVSIMIEQLALHFGYYEFIIERDRKIERLKEMMG